MFSWRILLDCHNNRMVLLELDSMISARRGYKAPNWHLSFLGLSQPVSGWPHIHKGCSFFRAFTSYLPLQDLSESQKKGQVPRSSRCVAVLFIEVQLLCRGFLLVPSFSDPRSFYRGGAVWGQQRPSTPDVFIGGNSRWIS